MGFIHVYCGDGKGKTTAAVGLSLRAAAAGKKVLFVQFLKDGTSSEISILKKIKNITVICGKACDKFSFEMTNSEKSKTLILHNENMKKALLADADVFIFDEICGALGCGLLDESLVKEAIALSKNSEKEIVFTGRNPKQFMLESADYISEIKKIRHPFDKGIPARKGIEF